MLGVRPVKPGPSQWCHHPLYTAYTVWCLILFMIWRLTECMCFNLIKSGLMWEAILMFQLMKELQLLVVC